MTQAAGVAKVTIEGAQSMTFGPATNTAYSNPYSIVITDSEGNAVELDEENYFTVPAGDVNITAEFTELHKHAPVYVAEVPASCGVVGVKAHYACECGKLVSKETKIDILVTPAVTIIVGGALSICSSPGGMMIISFSFRW